MIYYHKSHNLSILKMNFLIIITKRVMGIEPTYSAWKADVLPLNYTRIGLGGCLDDSKYILNDNEFNVKHFFNFHIRHHHRIMGNSPLLRSAITEWMEKDSNLRSRRQQIYSLPPLATRESIHIVS